MRRHFISETQLVFVQTVGCEERFVSVAHAIERGVGGSLFGNRVSQEVIWKIGEVLLTQHLVKDVEPSLLAADSHEGREPRAAKGRGEGHFRASKRRLHQSRP